MTDPCRRQDGPRIKKPCRHEQATFSHMADAFRSVYRCDSCGWLHSCEVDPVTGDIVDVSAP